MISLGEFGLIFNERHDFNYDDQFLTEVYKHIIFNDIPEGWAVCVEEYLYSLENPEIVSSVSQLFGQIIIEFCGVQTERDKKRRGVLEGIIQRIDLDLHEELAEGIVLN